MVSFFALTASNFLHQLVHYACLWCCVDPNHCWRITANLPDNQDPELSINEMVLVRSFNFEMTLAGFNVVEVVILNNPDKKVMYSYNSWMWVGAF